MRVLDIRTKFQMYAEAIVSETLENGIQVNRSEKVHVINHKTKELSLNFENIIYLRLNLFRIFFDKFKACLILGYQRII